MKKQSGLAEFLRSKSFYALLCVGTLAIIAMLLVGLNRPSDENNLVDLNEPINTQVLESEDEVDLATDDNNTTPNNIANIPSDIMGGVAQSQEDNLNIGEGGLDVYENNAIVATDDPLLTQEETTKVDTATEVESSDVPQVVQETTEPSAEVMKTEAPYFDEEAKLMWPVVGEVVSSFGREYDPTTKMSKVNEGIAISANVGDAVKASAAGIVTNILNDDRVGLTMEVSIGNGYTLVYGQLQDVKVKVGDYMEQGEIIASVAPRSKFYSEQGNNVYLRLEKDEVAENPELYLSSDK